MKKMVGMMAVVFGVVSTAAEPGAPGGPLGPYGVDPARKVDGVYRGRFTPDADYVLSGQLRRDIGDLPHVPYRYLGEEEGYEATALSPVPEPGVHPRVLMSPEDVARIRSQVAQGEKADRYFRIVWADIQARAAKGELLERSLVALATGDEALARAAAADLVAEARFREPMVDLLNTHEATAGFRDNWWYYTRFAIEKVGGEFYRDAYEAGGGERVRELAGKGVEFVTGEGSARGSGGLFNSPLMAYDYVAEHLAPEERDLVRRVIAKMTHGRYTAGMELPAHMFINNHMSMGEDLIVLALCIEGEEGYDPRILREYSHAVWGKLTYDISPQGHLYEKCKGFLPERAVLAISRRADAGGLPLLRHSHLKAMVWAKVMDAVHVFYSTQPPDLGQLKPENRRWWMGYGSGPWMDQFFNWAFLMKHVYPRDPTVDFFYKERLFQEGFGPVDAAVDVPLPPTRIRYTWRDVMLLTATDGLRDSRGVPIEYNRTAPPAEVTARTGAYVDLVRGVGMVRSSWEPDALHLHYECRSDGLAAGHESPEAGDFNLVADGVIWSMRRDWYMAPYFRSVVLINGKAGVYPPVPGKLMEVIDGSEATTFVSDLTDQYNWKKKEKNFYSWHGLREEQPWFALEYGGLRWGRKWELPFLPQLREYQEGYAGLDWGNWHGETRGPEMFEQWNDVEHVFRTVHMTKGEKPYVLIVDDVKMDGQPQQYDWVMHVEPDIALARAMDTVGNRYTEEGMPEDRTTDLILCRRDVSERRMARNGVAVERQPGKGEPLLLVRVLWRNSNHVFPAPAFEQGWGSPRITVPAHAVEPEFRVLLFPFREGEPLPLTWWNADRSRLFVRMGDQTDIYTFGETDRGRSLLVMEREGEGEPLLRTPAAPPAPLFDSPHPWTADRNHPEELRPHVFHGEGEIRLRRPLRASDVTYTLDGSEPTPASTPYHGPVTVKASGIFKARAFARYWPFADDSGSECLTLRLEQRPLAPAAEPAEASLKPGLACEVFERHQNFFDPGTGIFTGKKNMLPDLDVETARFRGRIPGLQLPVVDPLLPVTEMAWGFYRLRGYLQVPTDGVYGFRLESCGPVRLRVGGQTVLGVTGVYGLSEKARYGQAALEAGWQEVELVVSDPVFWKAGEEGPYQPRMAWMAPGGDRYENIPDSRWFSEVDWPAVSDRDWPRGSAVDPGDTLPGLVLHVYDRSAVAREIPEGGLPPGHFELGAEDRPYRIHPVLAPEDSGSAMRMLEYRGFLKVTEPGLYRFELPREGGNQLWIDGVLVAQNRVAAPAAPGGIVLEPGWHHLSWRLADSPADCRMWGPGESGFRPLSTGMFARPAVVESHAELRRLFQLDGSLLRDDLVYADDAGAEVRLYDAVIVPDGYRGSGIRLRGGKSCLMATGLACAEDALTFAAWIRVDKPKDGQLFAGAHRNVVGTRLRGYRVVASYGWQTEGVDAEIKSAGAHEGKWVHVAVVYSPRQIELYVNGVKKGYVPKTRVDRSARVSALDLFQGLEVTVDEVQLFNAALDPAAVRVLAAPVEEGAP